MPRWVCLPGMKCGRGGGGRPGVPLNRRCLPEKGVGRRRGPGCLAGRMVPAGARRDGGIFARDGLEATASEEGGGGGSAAACLEKATARLEKAF